MNINGYNLVNPRGDQYSFTSSPTSNRKRNRAAYEEKKNEKELPVSKRIRFTQIHIHDPEPEIPSSGFFSFSKISSFISDSVVKISRLFSNSMSSEESEKSTLDHSDESLVLKIDQIEHELERIESQLNNRLSKELIYDLELKAQLLAKETEALKAIVPGLTHRMDNLRKQIESLKPMFTCEAPGLPNLGNTCYMNSILQMLATSEEYDTIIFSPPQYKTRSCLEISELLKEVIQAIRLGKQPDLDLLWTLHSALARAKVVRPIGVQEDASEFFTRLCDFLGNYPNPIKEDEWAVFVFNGIPTPKLIRQKETYSIDLNLLEPSSITSLLTQHYSSTKMEISHGKLEKNTPESVEKSLERFLIAYAGEETNIGLYSKDDPLYPVIQDIISSDKPSDEKALLMQARFAEMGFPPVTVQFGYLESKVLSIKELPPRLELHIVRLGQYTQGEKVSLRVNKKLTIGLETEENRAIEHHYLLDHVITRLGEDVDRGHYIFYKQTPKGWFIFNDSRVSGPYRFEDIEKELSQSGYTFVYRRQNF